MKITIPKEYQVFYEFKAGDDVRKYPDPVLYEVAQPVKEFAENIKELVENMIKIVQSYEGCVGLAANQVGRLERVCIVECDEELITLINPEILEVGEDAPCIAGCMSFPFLRATNHYPSSMTVKFYDVNGNEHIKQFEGFPSFCVQHEIDHLNGVLFIDKADPDSLAWENEESREERVRNRKENKK